MPWFVIIKSLGLFCLYSN